MSQAYYCPTQGCDPSADSGAGPFHSNQAGDEQALIPGVVFGFGRMGWRDRVKSREREGVRPRRLDGLVD
jgi:hypothetical protein